MLMQMRLPRADPRQSGCGPFDDGPDGLADLVSMYRQNRGNGHKITICPRRYDRGCHVHALRAEADASRPAIHSCPFLWFKAIAIRSRQLKSFSWDNVQRVHPKTRCKGQAKSRLYRHGPRNLEYSVPDRNQYDRNMAIIYISCHIRFNKKYMDLYSNDAVAYIAVQYIFRCMAYLRSVCLIWHHGQQRRCMSWHSNWEIYSVYITWLKSQY